ncbi:MAG: hypothetical protein HOC83_11110 [Polaribacter sp.]|nr:hypothetical protein [Polaribacter sp.]
MNAKWYISTLFLIFSLFGALQEQVSIPNQEIVLEFVDTKINRQNIENTIANVRKKLRNIGASNITLRETKNGTLKISYFSIVDVENIKEAIIKGNKFVLDKNTENKDKNNTTSDYSIDIYELTKSSDISNLDFKFVFEIKQHSDRFTTDNYFALIKKRTQCKRDQLFKIPYKIHKNNPFTKDKTSHEEPEVRAGPKNYNS